MRSITHHSFSQDVARRVAEDALDDLREQFDEYDAAFEWGGRGEPQRGRLRLRYASHEGESVVAEIYVTANAVQLEMHAPEELEKTVSEVEPVVEKTMIDHFRAAKKRASNRSDSGRPRG